MAREDGSQTGDLALLEAIEKEPWRFGLLSLIRRLDSVNPDGPATGQSSKPSEDPIRFSQDPYNEFASSTLRALHRDEGKKPRLVQSFFGLFGPDGPLPTHLTEFARDRERQHRDPTISRFADIFHHRLISLFYRAWAQSQPTVQYDRPEQDRFAGYLAALMGVRPESLHSLDAMHFSGKLGFAGHFGSLPRHPTGLERLVESYFDVPVKVEEFVAHWLTIPRKDRISLGRMSGGGRLGQSAVIGKRVWQRQDKFRITLGPLDLDSYSAFLPTGKSFKALVAAVHHYIGPEMLWEVKLVLQHEQKPVTCLGKSGALGWTSWLQQDEEQQDVSDLRLQVQNYVH